MDIYENNLSENFTKTNIYSSMGITLPISTTIKLNILKNTFFIEILNKENNNNIEKIKKDIIY